MFSQQHHYTGSSKANMGKACSSTKSFRPYLIWYSFVFIMKVLVWLFLIIFCMLLGVMMHLPAKTVLANLIQWKDTTLILTSGLWLHPWSTAVMLLVQHALVTGCMPLVVMMDPSIWVQWSRMTLRRINGKKLLLLTLEELQPVWCLYQVIQ